MFVSISGRITQNKVWHIFFKIHRSQCMTPKSNLFTQNLAFGLICSTKRGWVNEYRHYCKKDYGHFSIDERIFPVKTTLKWLDAQLGCNTLSVTGLK